MNERYHKLAKQCVTRKFYVDHASEEFDYKKFAELIIEECMEQVWYTREDGINGNVSEVIKDRIKEHFGVGMSTEDKKTLIKELLGVKNETN